MLAINSKTILRLALFSRFCFCLGCNQNSIAVSEPVLAIQPTPPVVSNAKVADEEIKYYSPSETCEKIKNNDERSLCEAIIKDQDLTDQALIGKFVYASRRVDLNSDGRDEVVVWSPTQDLGGTSGYPIIIFSQTANGYKKLWDIDQAWTPILVLKSKSHGWRDIAFQQGGGGAEWLYLISRYDGKSYKIEKDQKKQPKGKILIDKDWNQSVLGPIPSQ
jgi:hypothetical protein